MLLHYQCSGNLRRLASRNRRYIQRGDYTGTRSASYSNWCQLCTSTKNVVVFEIADKKELYTIQLRNFVAIMRDDIRPEQYDLRVRATEQAVETMMAERIVNIRLRDLKDFKLEGSEEKFRSFMACFESNWNK